MKLAPGETPINPLASKAAAQLLVPCSTLLTRGSCERVYWLHKTAMVQMGMQCRWEHVLRQSEGKLCTCECMLSLSALRLVVSLPPFFRAILGRCGVAFCLGKT